MTADRVYARNEEIEAGAPPLWHEVRRRLAGALAAGWIDPGPEGATGPAAVPGTVGA